MNDNHHRYVSIQKRIIQLEKEGYEVKIIDDVTLECRNISTGLKTIIHIQAHNNGEIASII